VSAALVRCVADQPTDADLAKVTVVTVSTGIAARTYDVAAGAIPTDRKAGVQGEIGHLPVEFRFLDRGFHQMCDCGGASHLNAFASGRGIDRTLGLVCFAFPTTYGRSILSALTGGQPGAARVSHLVDAVHMDDPAAWSLLDAFTAPLARILLTHLAFDPQVERVILVGGVVHAFGPTYLKSVLSHLEGAGLYQISERNPGVFRDRFVIGPDDDHSGLIGAAIAARQALAGSPNRGSPRRRGWSVRASLPIEYRVEVVDDLLEPGNPAIVNSQRRPSGLRRRLVVVDRSVQERYGDRLRRYFDSCCDEFALMPLDATETRKDAGAVARLLRTFDGFNLLRRSEPVVAVGGGVLLDVVGFAASIYRRGTPYIRVPTTLVAMIDAGVGVKTGVNFRGSKNRIGTYFPPIASLIDRSFLRTLPSRHLRSGMAEVVKMAIACDSTLFDLVESHGATLVAERFQSDLGEEVIRRAVTEMLDELEPNLWEHTLERAVDLGHTFSPVLEASPQGGLLHGEAVALDLALSSVIARNRGLLRPDELDRILGVIRTLGLPVHDSLITMPLLLRGLKNATLHRDGAQRLPVPTSIGMVTWLNDVTASEIECAARSLAAVR
jgi:3-dehydroquinate synthetase/predicted NBD/HSP70 family sugar kinase